MTGRRPGFDQTPDKNAVAVKPVARSPAARSICRVPHTSRLSRSIFGTHPPRPIPPRRVVCYTAAVGQCQAERASDSTSRFRARSSNSTWHRVRRPILFNAPNNAFVSAAQVSPDGKWIVMAYAPPEDPELQSVNTDLYVMPADGSAAPQVLLKRASSKEDFFNPVWSADGKYVYYSHLMPDRQRHQQIYQLHV